MSSRYSVHRNLLTDSFCIYDDHGPVDGFGDVESRGDALNHIRDLEAADRLRAEQDAAQFADDHAAADAMAYGSAASISEAA